MIRLYFHYVVKIPGSAKPSHYFSGKAYWDLPSPWGGVEWEAGVTLEASLVWNEAALVCVCVCVCVCVRVCVCVCSWVKLYWTTLRWAWAQAGRV